MHPSTQGDDLKIWNNNLTKWKQSGPLSISEIISKSGIDLNQLEKDDVEIKKVSSASNYQHGMHKKGTTKFHGIARFVHKYGAIVECMYQKDSMNGFGRVFKDDGASYEGMWKDGLYHGHGKLTMANGTVREGKWEKNKFKG